ncbi:hypothetical protein M2317_000772 [Microbacterium sp. ZKA21]|uniref:hypothetical protein n=1 Tax=Microbacterium sp. ZKA21 TaxID=3381694 RepID=UPI003D1EB963
MAKSTPAGVEREMERLLGSFKERAAAVKDAHRATRQKIQNDPMLSALAKQNHLAKLDDETRGKLATLRAEQDAKVSGIRTRLERELAGNQPTDASSVLLRRDAADRARRIADEADALSVLADAARSGDDTLADAVGYRARHAGWVDALDAYKAARPEAADSAVALAFVEGLASDPGQNLANQIAYSAP